MGRIEWEKGESEDSGIALRFLVWEKKPYIHFGVKEKHLFLKREVMVK